MSLPMFHEIDARLKDWICGVVGDVEISLAAPGREQDASGVGLYLLELVDDPPPRGSSAPPLRMALRYLVTTFGDASEAHRRLGELAFAALAHPDLTICLAPLRAECWAAFGSAPRPAFVLRVPVSRERDVEPRPRVTEELLLRTGGLLSLQGVVVGPGDVPIAGAHVRVPEIGKQAVTDARGRFRLAGLPAAPAVTRLVVRAKGREHAVTDEHGFSAGAPVTIHINPLEG